ncbi:MAG: hypothetical protein ACPGSM_02190 [Thiolinea sp.]
MWDVLKRGLSVLVVLSVISCGGGSGDNYIVGVDTTTGGNSDTDSGNTDTTDTDSTDDTDTTDTAVDNRIADLEVAASSRQLGSNGAEPVVISAVVKDKNNNTLKDVDVQFAVDNNGTIEPDEGIADSSVKTAKLTPGLNRPENRTLLVTVTAGNQVRTVEIEVTGTVVQLDGPERIVINTPTQFVAKLKDSTGAGLPYQLVDLQSSGGNMIGATSDLGFYTDDDGEITFTVTASGSGTDTIMAAALGAKYSHNISVSGDEFTLESANQEINVETDEAVNLLWKHDGVAQVGKQINLTATRGAVPNNVTTDAEGKASFSLNSSTAGGTVVTAVDTETGLTTSMVREFVAIAPKYLSVQSEQGNIGPEEQTTVFALVRDVNDNPVKNQKVTFNLYDAVNGNLSSSIATTDSLGRASVVYTAGNATSAKDGVVIVATLQSNPTITDELALTVGKRALRIVLGADEELEESGVFYQKSYGVIVTDSAGNPVPDKAVDFTLIPTHYHKGYMVCDAETQSWVPQYNFWGCPSEDVDNDGWLDENEDYNGSGALEPTHTATVNTKTITDQEGKATVQVTYPQSQALWSRLRLIATISDEGSEYFETAEFDLPVAGPDVDTCDRSPPNSASPYGAASSCGSPL